MGVIWFATGRQSPFMGIAVFVSSFLQRVRPEGAGNPPVVSSPAPSEWRGLLGPEQELSGAGLLRRKANLPIK